MWFHVYVFLATDIKVISILEEIKWQVRFNTKLLQNILTKVDVPVSVGGNEADLDLGIEFPLKDMDDLNALEEQLDNSEVVKALQSPIYEFILQRNEYLDIVIVLWYLYVY